MGGFYPHAQSRLLMLSIAWDRLHGKAIGLISLCRKHLEIWKWSGFAGGEKGTWAWKKGGMEPQFMVSSNGQLMKHDDSAVDAMSFFQYFQTNIMRDMSNISTKKCLSFQKIPFFSPENPIFSVRCLASALPLLPSHVKCHSHLLHWLLAMGTVWNGGNGIFKMAQTMAQKTWHREDVTPNNGRWMDFSQEFLLIRFTMAFYQRWKSRTNSRRCLPQQNGWAKSVVLNFQLSDVDLAQ